MVAGRLLAQRALAANGRPRDDGASRALPPTSPKAVDLSDFPCQLGDVVVRAVGGDEAWLAGALVFTEGEPIAVLFVGPEAGGDHYVYVRREDDGLLAWLKRESASLLGDASAPPSTIDLEGEHYARSRNLPLRVERIGTGLPDVGSEATVSEYTSENGGFVLLVQAKELACYRGERLLPGTYDVLAGDKARV